MRANKVVVTGVGIASAIGNNKQDFWNNIIQGRNGIRLNDQQYSNLREFGIEVLGVINNLDEEIANAFNSPKIRRMGKLHKMVFHCINQAMKDADIDETSYESLGIICGTGIDYSTIQSGHDVMKLSPKEFFHTYPNVLVGEIAHYFPLQGYVSTIVNACCSATQAIGEGFRKIRNGEEQILIVGGADDKINNQCAAGFSRLGMISKNDNPSEAMRPFDKDRDGMVMGQGACFMVIENYNHAVNRNACIMGEVSGYGTSIDGISIADASAKGKILAMERALKDAGISYKKVGYINAHGTSTVSNDRAEGLAIQQVFQEKSGIVPISSTKSSIGHTFAACGAIQSYVCLKCLEEGVLPANNNFINGDPSMQLNILKQAEQKNIDYCITNTSGISGVNSSLVFKRFA